MQQQFTDVLTSASAELYGEQAVSPTITVPDAKFGDYASNVALQLAGKLSKNPRAVAEEIVNYIKNNQPDWLASASVAGPGFINIFVSDAAIFNSFSAVPTDIYSGKKIIVEYSDPNAFKALHAGHLYTTLVGNAIGNVLEATGAQVVRLNYGGDVGLHAAKAMWGITRSLGGEYPDKLTSIDEPSRPKWVSECYVNGNSAYTDDPVAKAEITDINKKIYALHASGDESSAFAQIYFTCRAWSYDGFKKLYDELGVQPFDEYIPESKVTPLGEQTVQTGLQRGIFIESEGAVVYEESKSGLHTRVFKTSAGLPTYEAKELGLAVYKWQTYQFDKSLVITANDIVEYMKVLFSAMTHFYPEVTERTSHITHGMIKFSSGQKMSSRTGKVLMAQDILASAMQANLQSSGKEDARVAIGAVKYAFLKQRIGGDIAYDPEESISLSGNSGPYLQYAHARACSILAKAEANSGQAAPQIDILDEFERDLAVKLAEYVDVVHKAATEFMPHHICTYLYELAQVFNRFYEHSQVIGSDRENIRLTLVMRYKNVLSSGLSLLGMDAPDHM